VKYNVEKEKQSKKSGGPSEDDRADEEDDVEVGHHVIRDYITVRTTHSS
jgi:hypothetical protein